MGVLVGSIQAAGKPPSPEQAAEIGRLQNRLYRATQATAVLLLLAVILHGRGSLRPLMIRPSRAAFAFIFITVALDMLALGIIIPVLPKLVVEFEGGDVAHAARTVGVFGFAWAAMQFLASPLVGAVSDRFGRRPVVLLSNFGLDLDSAVMGRHRLVGVMSFSKALLRQNPFNPFDPYFRSVDA